MQYLKVQVAAVWLLMLAFAPVAAGQPLSSTERARIDEAVRSVLATTGAPSAAFAIVRGGAVVYENAFGVARIAPETPAAPTMRYAIGSVSKQFTATAVLLLQEQGKLSIDDTVGKWFPQLTRANEVSVRQLLSMTSGYQDYWPQDYVFMDMQRPAPASEIMARWAGKELDFPPGTKWQYSNTNYVIAAAIVERVAGIPFFEFLQQRVFAPLRMTSVRDFDRAPLAATDAQPLLRNALGPFREAPKEAAGWLFGAGQLAMTAHDLALWNISMIDRSLLKPESYKVMHTDMLLAPGTATGYGLGVQVSAPGGRRRIAHGGAVSGYTTASRIYPDDRAAVVVFTNIYPGAANAPGAIADRIANVIFAESDAARAAARDQARAIYDALVKGQLDRTLFTPAANAYFTAEVLADYATSLSPLGAPTEFVSTGESPRGGMLIRSYRIRAGNVTMDLTTMTLPDGKLDQYVISRAG